MIKLIFIIVTNINPPFMHKVFISSFSLNDYRFIMIIIL